MNAFQHCRNTGDAVPLYLPQQLYLKPSATICISVQLPPKSTGHTIIHGEIIQKLKSLITPDDFTSIKVTRAAVDVVRFEAELELAAYVQRVLHKLDNKFIKLKDITQLLKVKSSEGKLDFPSKHDWDSYFRDTKDMNEMKFGERPDTIHFANLPIKWFVSEKHAKHYDCKSDEPLLPSEKIFYYTFEKYGDIRHVDIPICDPYRCKMKSHITGMQSSTFEDKDFFEGYVQFKEYVGFVECMNALRGMKLMRKERHLSSGGEALTIKMYVDFDKTKHLTEGAIKRRDILRERLILKQKSREDIEREKQAEIDRKLIAERQKTDEIRNEKQRRRREREEKRKAKILAQLQASKGQENDDFQAKIAQEEKKLLTVQRRLEAIRLVEDLFKRLESKLSTNHKNQHLPEIKTNQLKRLKLDFEQEFTSQRDKLSKAIEGRVILRSIVATTAREVGGDISEDAPSNSSDDSIGNPECDAGKVYPTHPLNAPPPAWYPYPYWPAAPPAHIYPANPPGRPYYYGPGRRGGGGGRYRGQAGPSNGRVWRPRGGHYSGRTSKFNSERYTHSRSRSRSRTRYRSSSRSRSRSRTRTRTRSRSRSKSRRRWTRSRSRSSSHSRHTPSRSRSRSRSSSTSRTRKSK